MAVLACAFVTGSMKISNAVFTTRYYWDFHTGILGTYQGSFSSHSAAKLGSGCADLQPPDCSRGYLQSQLNDPTQPGSSTNPPKAVNIPFPDDRLLK